MSHVINSKLLVETDGFGYGSVQDELVGMVILDAGLEIEITSMVEEQTKSKQIIQQNSARSKQTKIRREKNLSD